MRRKASLIQLTSTMWEKMSRLQIPLVSWKWKRKWRRRPVRMKWWRIEGREGGEGGGQALKRLPSAWEELSTMCKGWMSCKRAGRPKSRRLVSEEERKKANCLCLMFHMNVIYVSFSWWYIEKIFSWEALQIYIFLIACMIGLLIVLMEPQSLPLISFLDLYLRLVPQSLLYMCAWRLYLWTSWPWILYMRTCTCGACTLAYMIHGFIMYLRFLNSFEMKIYKNWWKIDEKLMKIWCRFDALLMHFWCTFEKCIKSASKVHQKCIKFSSNLHQFSSKSVPTLHHKYKDVCVNHVAKLYQKVYANSIAQVHQNNLYSTS